MLWASLLGLMTGLVAVELIPDIAAQGATLRTARMGLRQASKYHLHAINLVQLLGPDALGGPAASWQRQVVEWPGHRGGKGGGDPRDGLGRRFGIAGRVRMLGWAWSRSSRRHRRAPPASRVSCGAVAWRGSPAAVAWRGCLARLPGAVG